MPSAALSLLAGFTVRLREGHQESAEDGAASATATQSILIEMSAIVYMTTQKDYF